MASYNNITFTTFWNNNLPPRRRLPKRIARGAVYMKPLQWLRDMFFDQYVNRASAGFYWGSIYPYFPGDIVAYRGDYKVYQVKEDVSPPIGTLPTDTAYWYKVADYPVGFDIRQRATSERLKLEYLLNKLFGGTYQNPPATSDIFITNEAVLMEYFIAGYTENECSVAVYQNDDAGNFVGATNPTYDEINFTINIPISLFNALATTNAQREKIIRAYVDERVVTGLLYRINTY